MADHGHKKWPWLAPRSNKAGKWVPARPLDQCNEVYDQDTFHRNFRRGGGGGGGGAAAATGPSHDPEGNSDGPLHRARHGQREQHAIPVSEGFAIWPALQARRGFEHRQHNPIPPQAVVPGPSQAPRRRPRPDATVASAKKEAGAILQEFIRSNELHDNAEAVIKCYIDARGGGTISDDAAEWLLVALARRLDEEDSRTIWTKVLKTYCTYAYDEEEEDDDDLRKCLVKALHSSHERLRKLDTFAPFENLKKNGKCAPVLISLLLETLSHGVRKLDE